MITPEEEFIYLFLGYLILNNLFSSLNLLNPIYTVNFFTCIHDEEYFHTIYPFEKVILEV